MSLWQVLHPQQDEAQIVGWPQVRSFRKNTMATTYNVDLGTACGKYFRVSCLSIVDPGDSDIIKSIPGDQ
ncbi:hypothetical protein F2Q68_00045395 [Brassica cretica]|uniref:Auxin-responsive protein n=1 Tax=Brassica cretica TaxID=69181 RepID=A0A8S9LHR3_BRACR|nr:hypothetical protein F2Q68_00045395 [Brassica cretica]